MIALAAAVCAASATLLLGSAFFGNGRAAAMVSLEPPESSDPPATRGPGHGLSTRARVGAGAGLGGALGGALAGPPGVVGGAFVGGLLARAVVRRRVLRLAQRTEEQLVDAVTAISSAVRSGRSLVQAIAVAGEEIGDPLGGMLADAADRTALGMPFDEVLDELARRIGGSDARLVTGVLRLHRRTGGALASSLDDLGRTLRSRRDGARELRSLTAQARLSAAILGLLPLGFFLFLSVVARRDVEAAYRSAAGGSAIAIGLILQGAAFVWIRALLRVERA